VADVLEVTGWPLKVSPDLTTTEAPTEAELTVLRDLAARRRDSVPSAHRPGQSTQEG
jgi:hypothetical protein